jgi:hypothetical protein
LERLLVAQHGIEDRKKLSHTSSERHFLELASFQQVLVLGPDQRVVACGHQGRHIQHTAHIGSPTFGLAIASDGWESPRFQAVCVA